MAYVGTLDWARETGGRLRLRDRLRLLPQAAAFYARQVSGRAERCLGLAGTGFQLDLDAVRVPDSPLAKAVEAHVEAVSPTWLAAHCARSFLWASLLAKRDGIVHDAELLYVACLLHDLGLTEHHEDTYDDVHCFAVEGAYAARDLGALQRWDAERRDRLAEAITLHLNVTVEVARGPEAHLLHEGTALDTAGARYHDLHGDTRDAVIDRHPRAGAPGMKAGLIPTFKRQCCRRPGSRAAFLCLGGFLGHVRRAPFAN
ncbi:MAG: HD domain-containing protein [Bacteroidota bacterium]